MRTNQTKERGAFGVTVVAMTPDTKRSLEFDVTNCPHCGRHHVSMESSVEGDRVTLRCPALGGAPLVLTIKMFLHPLPR